MKRFGSFLKGFLNLILSIPMMVLIVPYLKAWTFLNGTLWDYAVFLSLLMGIVSLDFLGVESLIKAFKDDQVIENVEVK